MTVPLPLAERDRFRVGQVRSITPGLAFRFRAFISLIGWNIVSLIRATSLEAFEVVPRTSCCPSAAARNGGRSDLAVNREELYGGGNLSYKLGWIKDEEITLPVPLNFVSNHHPGVSRVL